MKRESEGEERGRRWVRGKGEGLGEGLRYWHDVSKSTSMCTVCMFVHKHLNKKQLVQLHLNLNI